jgi:cytochrome c oxidase subunit IV
MAAEQGHQEHPLGIYWFMWIALFVLSAGSYATDFMEHGTLRTTLILTFMMLKAGGIVAVFMHMKWERLALKFAILLPPIAICIFIWLMAVEGDYTFLTRIEFFGESNFVPQSPHH